MKYLLLISIFLLSACSANFESIASKVPTGDLGPSNKEQDFVDPIDYADLENQLKGDGLGGWVHGAVNDQNMFVFTWRSPDSFFINVQLPMTTRDPLILEKLKELRRHDFVVLKGEFVQNQAPIQHIRIDEVVSVKKWTGPTGNYNYETGIPEDLEGQTELIGKVHAIANGGAVVVIEYGDRVLPVFNIAPNLAASLYRNDKIKLKYVIQNSPGRPAHLNVDTSASHPIEVLEAIVDGHDETIRLCGALVQFPQSPQIKFNVYALRTEDSDGIKRNYTIVNFSDFDLFQKIREKLEKAWDEEIDSVVYDRNKFLNPKIMVCAKGLKNLVSPVQANPQILPEALEDVEVFVSNP